MRLDFLQNHPLNKEINDVLINLNYPNPSPINPKDYELINQDRIKLADYFNTNMIFNFNNLASSWCEFLLKLSRYYKIAYSISNHQQSYQAQKILTTKPFYLIPDKNSGIIEKQSLEIALDLGANCFIIPFVNQDILTLNKIEEIKFFLKQSLKDFLLICDISYFINFSKLNNDLLDKNTIFILDGSSIGLIQGYGVMITKDFEKQDIFSNDLKNPKLFEAILKALKTIKIPKNNTQNEFYNILKEFFKEDLNTFAPLENTFFNSLPLCFKGIKARHLLQALLIQKIHAINGQECLFGLAKPSFVLQEMGYSEARSRELLSISYHHIDDMEKTAKILTQTYKQIKALEL